MHARYLVRPLMQSGIHDGSLRLVCPSSSSVCSPLSARHSVGRSSRPYGEVGFMRRARRERAVRRPRLMQILDRPQDVEI